MSRGRGAALFGAAIVAAHAIGFAALAARSGGTDLVVELCGPLSFQGTVPASLASRVEIADDGGRPGLRRRRWTTHYRGGFTRQVGATELVGPFQDPAAPSCSGRVIVGQQLLDDGHAGPGTIAGAMAQTIDSELRGEDVFPVGGYQRVERLSLRWARLESHAGDRKFVGDAPDGYIRAAANIVFERVEVPIVVAFVPQRAGHFRIAAHAELAFGSSVFQWVSDEVGGDRLATKLARRELDDLLVTTLAPPPPFDLSDGQTLQFVYCDGHVEIADGAWGAVPFGVALGRLDHVLPPRFGIGSRQPPAPTTTLAIDLDVDALDAMLFELWRTGWLDRRLAEIGLDRRFNTNPIVTQYLSIRLSPLHLALPPTIEADASSLRLAADARVTLADGNASTTGRVFGSLAFHFTGGARLPIAVDLDALELACERSPTTLVPCYADLVDALRDRGHEFHGALTEAFARLVFDVFVDRHIAATGLPVELVIRGATPSLAAGTLHLDLDAALR